MTKEPKIRKRVCPKCRTERDEFQYAYTQSPFFPGKRSIICTSCLEKMHDPTNWESVDKILQWLDLPFFVDTWTQLYKTHKEHTLSAYFNFIGDEKYATLDWSETNEKWKAAIEQGTLEQEVQDLGDEWLRKMRAHWSDTYTREDYLFLEGLYNDIVATQNVSTPILKKYAEDFCELTLQIKKGLRKGIETKKLMDARDNIIKIAEFTATNAKNVSDFDSVGELFLYLYRLGWRPNWAKEKKDVVDITMHNVQQYLKRLVIGEGNLAEQVELREESYAVSQKLEDNLMDEIQYANFDEHNVKIDFEGDDDLAYELSEFDV